MSYMLTITQLCNLYYLPYLFESFNFSYIGKYTLLHITFDHSNEACKHEKNIKETLRRITVTSSLRGGGVVTPLAPIVL
jgi:hypothetical protein